jgi:hypothetical protein
MKTTLHSTDVVMAIMFWAVPMTVVDEGHSTVQYPTARMSYCDAVNHKHTTPPCGSSSMNIDTPEGDDLQLEVPPLSNQTQTHFLQACAYSSCPACWM